MKAGDGFQAYDGFEFIADEDGCHSAEEFAEKRALAVSVPKSEGDEDDGLPEFRRLRDGGVVNARNGRAVVAKFLPVGAGHELATVYFCYDGNPADPAMKAGTDVYRSVNRGVLEDPEDAEAWLFGKWPSSLKFIEGF